MRIKSIIFTLLGCLAVSITWSQEIDYFVNLAKENHPLLQAQSASYEAAKTKENQVSALQDPVLSAGYNVLPDGMEKANISLMQNFSWFGTAKHQKYAAQAETQSQAYNLESLNKQIEIEVSSLYYDLQNIMQTIAVKQNYYQVYKSLETIAQDNLETSKGSMVDVIRAQIKKENAAVELKQLKQKHSNLIYALNKLVGRPTEDTIKINPIDYKSIQPVINVNKHPQILAIKAKMKQSDELIKVNHKESLPKLGIGVEYMRMNPSGNEIMPMISVSIPIYRKKYNAGKKEIQWRKKALEYQKQWTKNQFYRESNKLKSDIKDEEYERESLQKQLRQIKEAYQLTLNYYSVEGTGFKDVLELKEEQLSYKIQLIENNTQLLKLEKQLTYYKD